MSEPQYNIDHGYAAPVEIAYGSRKGPLIIPTKMHKDRVWPSWSLRYHITDAWPNLQKRYDEGGNIDARHEIRDFVEKTHIHVGNDVWIIRDKSDGIVIYPSIVSFDQHKGHVSRWLDTLNLKEMHGFSEVVDVGIATTLFRRGYIVMCMADDNADQKRDWLPVHIWFPDKAEREQARKDSIANKPNK